MKIDADPCYVNSRLICKWRTGGSHAGRQKWVSECYQSLTAHQHQKGHKVPKQVIVIATSIQVAMYSLSTALCESIRYQAKSEQNVRQDLIPRVRPRVRHGEAALHPQTKMSGLMDIHVKVNTVFAQPQQASKNTNNNYYSHIAV